MSISAYENLDPNQITGADYKFHSQWHIRQCLAWLDHIKRTNQHNSIRYAAIELRYGIELLWYEILIVSVGGSLSASEYARCCKEVTTMYKIIDKLSPNYEKRMAFTKIVASVDPKYPEIAVWDIKRLKRFYGETSKFLHFQGIPQDTFEDPNWLVRGIAKLEGYASYIWEMTSGKYTANMIDANMEPETRSVWKRFEAGEIDAEAARMQLRLALPILEKPQAKTLLGRALAAGVTPLFCR